MKKWYKSRVIWLNVISGALEVVQLAGGLNIVPVGTITITTNILNIALRFLTKVPVGG